jgi:hypothetical protein
MLRRFAFLLLLPCQAQALELDMPIGLVQSSQSEQSLATLNLPTGVWNGSEVPSVTLTGQVMISALPCRSCLPRTCL